MTDAQTRNVAALGAIAVAGTDATTFLRAQLSNDVFRLGPGRHFLAAWCDAKGRTQMLAQVCEQDGRYLLIVPRSLIPGLIRRLRMFVLRAKVEVSDHSDAVQIGGACGATMPAPNERVVSDGRQWLGLPTTASLGPRGLIVSPSELPAVADSLAIDSADWQLQEIDSGLPAIVEPTQGLFVPQMLNLHWLMGIDFNKGCYPGQEVIARLHYRGKLTRRTFRLAWTGRQPEPGDEIVDAQGARQGTILRSAAQTESCGRLLAVLKLAATSQPLGYDRGELELLDLPYPTPAE